MADLTVDTETTEAQEQVKTKRRGGNPLMQSVYDSDLTGDCVVLYEKLDLVFKAVQDEALINTVLFKNYLAWRKDAVKREKLKAIERLKEQIQLMDIPKEEVLKLLSAQVA